MLGMCAFAAPMWHVVLHDGQQFEFNSTTISTWADAAQATYARSPQWMQASFYGFCAMAATKIGHMVVDNCANKCANAAQSRTKTESVGRVPELTNWDSSGDLQRNIVFMGNPGRGKSTLLNAIARESIFHAGVPNDFSTGMTFQLDEHIIWADTFDIHLWDTPGLNDMKKLEQAAQAIQAALQQKGQFKLFFLMGLDSGRLRKEDQNTILAILNSCKKGSSGTMLNEIGVIINQVQQEEVQTHKSKPILEARLRHHLEKLLREECGECEGGKNLEVRTMVNMHDPRLLCQRDVVLPLSPEMEAFIDQIKPIRIDAAHVQKADLEGTIKKLEQKVEEMHKEMEKYTQMRADLETELLTVKLQAQAQAEKFELNLEEELEKERKENAKNTEDLKERMASARARQTHGVTGAVFALFVALKDSIVATEEECKRLGKKLVLYDGEIAHDV